MRSMVASPTKNASRGTRHPQGLSQSPLFVNKRACPPSPPSPFSPVCHNVADRLDSPPRPVIIGHVVNRPVGLFVEDPHGSAQGRHHQRAASSGGYSSGSAERLRRHQRERLAGSRRRHQGKPLLPFPWKGGSGTGAVGTGAHGIPGVSQERLGWSDAVGSADEFFRCGVGQTPQHRFVGGCLWGNTALEMSDKNPRYVAQVGGVFDEWIALLEGVIRAGQVAGEIRDDMAADDLARFVVSAIEGGIMLSRLKKEERPLKTCFDSLKLFLRATAQSKERTDTWHGYPRKFRSS